MRRAVPVVIAAATIASASAGFAWANQPGGGSAPAAVAVRQPIHRVVWIGRGASEECGPNDCSGGGTARSFTMPGSGKYVAAVTMSFTYATKGQGTWSAGVQIGRRNTLPRTRPIATAPDPATATLVFRTHLVGGRSYTLSPEVDAANTSATYAIHQRAVLVEIDATPSHPANKAG
jgi:hypothetical protein